MFSRKEAMYSNLDRIVFVGSLIWVIHWSTKVTETVLNFIF